MPNLFELRDNIAIITDALDNALGGDDPATVEQLEAVLEGMNAQLKDKADAIVYAARAWELKAKSLKEESRRIGEIAESCANKAERIKGLAKRIMEAYGDEKLEGSIHTITLCKNGGKPPLIIDEGLDLSEIDPKYVNEVTTKTLAKDAVIDDLTNGVEIEWARLGERGTHVRFK